MLDCHSGDDLAPRSRQAVGRATNGRVHFKISPMLQLLFAEVLHDLFPDRFRFWWDDTVDSVRCEASAGSEFAAECLSQYENSGRQAPSPRHALFHHYGFASVGRRDADGQFVHRAKFYSLPAEFYREYHERLALCLHDVAEDVFARSPAGKTKAPPPHG